MRGLFAFVVALCIIGGLMAGAWLLSKDSPKQAKAAARTKADLKAPEPTSDDEPPAKQAKTPTPPKGKAKAGDGSDVANVGEAYLNNELAAAQKYENKRQVFSAVVTHVGKGKDGQGRMIAYAHPDDRKKQAAFCYGDAKGMANLEPPCIVTFEGICKGWGEPNDHGRILIFQSCTVLATKDINADPFRIIPEEKAEGPRFGATPLIKTKEEDLTLPKKNFIRGVTSK